MSTYRIQEDANGVRHFQDCGAFVDYPTVYVLNDGGEQGEDYCIGFIPASVLNEVRRGDKFYSCEMVFTVTNINKDWDGMKAVFVRWF